FRARLLNSKPFFDSCKTRKVTGSTLVNPTQWLRSPLDLSAYMESKGSAVHRLTAGCDEKTASTDVRGRRGLAPPEAFIGVASGTMNLKVMGKAPARSHVRHAESLPPWP